MIDVSNWSPDQLHRLDTRIEEVETEIAMRQSLKEKPKDPGLAQVYGTYQFVFCVIKTNIFINSYRLSDLEPD